jgi:hypothetical protein
MTTYTILGMADEGICEQRMRRIATSAVIDGIDCESIKGAANMIYGRTGRPVVGSYFAANESWHIVRVDGTDPADVEFFASGFAQVTTAAIAA